MEIWFTGETKLNNGLTVGALVELEGQTVAGGQIDDTIMYIKGNFGELQVGDTDDVRIQKSVTGPEASEVFQVDHRTYETLSFSNNPLTQLTSYGNNVAGVNTTLEMVEAASSKLIYLSPSFGGFSFGVSYAPDATADRQNNGGLTEADNDAGQNSEALSIAASYEGKWQNTGILASVGFTDSNNEDTTMDDVRAWQAGLNLDFGAFVVGGSYGRLENGLGNDLDVDTYAISGTYKTGRYKVGLGWSHGNYEVTSTREPELDTLLLSASYAMGPGVTLDAAIQHDRYDNDGTGAIGVGLGATDDYDSTAIMVGSMISF
ncbi:MAG: porin [Alphaproteobacteria bacterium]|nr:MAG: porin [Alphaproteobacteria bacterium]